MADTVPNAAPHLGAVVARRAAVLIAAWVILVEGNLANSLAGVPIAVAIAVYSLRLIPPLPRGRRRLWVLLRLVPRMIHLSLAGGLDVALRALRRRPDLDPDMITYRLDPPNASVATGLSVLLTLMPGTLAVDVTDDRILIHVLDRTQPVEDHLRPLEDGLRRALENGR